MVSAVEVVILVMLMVIIPVVVGILIAAIVTYRTVNTVLVKQRQCVRVVRNLQENISSSAKKEEKPEPSVSASGSATPEPEPEPEPEYATVLHNKTESLPDLTENYNSYDGDVQVTHNVSYLRVKH